MGPLRTDQEAARTARAAAHAYAVSEGAATLRSALLKRITDSPHAALVDAAGLDDAGSPRVALFAVLVRTAAEQHDPSP